MCKWPPKKHHLILSTKKIDMYWKSVSQLLKLLIALRESGNNSHANKIVSIIEELISKFKLIIMIYIIAQKLHAPAGIRFPRRRGINHGLNDLFQADLCEITLLSKYDNRCKYHLTVIEVYSKYAWGYIGWQVTNEPPPSLLCAWFAQPFPPLQHGDRARRGRHDCAVTITQTKAMECQPGLHGRGTILLGRHNIMATRRDTTSPTHTLFSSCIASYQIEAFADWVSDTQLLVRLPTTLWVARIPSQLMQSTTHYRAKLAAQADCRRWRAAHSWSDSDSSAERCCRLPLDVTLLGLARIVSAAAVGCRTQTAGLAVLTYVYACGLRRRQKQEGSEPTELAPFILHRPTLFSVPLPVQFPQLSVSWPSSCCLLGLASFRAVPSSLHRSIDHNQVHADRAGRADGSLSHPSQARQYRGEDVARDHETGLSNVSCIDKGSLDYSTPSSVSLPSPFEVNPRERRFLGIRRERCIFPAGSAVQYRLLSRQAHTARRTPEDRSSKKTKGEGASIVPLTACRCAEIVSARGDDTLFQKPIQEDVSPWRQRNALLWSVFRWQLSRCSPAACDGLADTSLRRGARDLNSLCRLMNHCQDKSPISGDILSTVLSRLRVMVKDCHLPARPARRVREPVGQSQHIPSIFFINTVTFLCLQNPMRQQKKIQSDRPRKQRHVLGSHYNMVDIYYKHFRDSQVLGHGLEARGERRQHGGRRHLVSGDHGLAYQRLMVIIIICAFVEFASVAAFAVSWSSLYVKQQHQTTATLEDDGRVLKQPTGGTKMAGHLCLLLKQLSGNLFPSDGDKGIGVRIRIPGSRHFVTSPGRHLGCHGPLTPTCVTFDLDLDAEDL
ncbi:hypothetical protein PR048_012590 [Dryococelus australis]|uniref:Uncharacterized protein n=1 Tax=Dryococelus australis TaxID=614101 RepID=A0ABQ9HPS9_9NEOP|nr:hypothetical protein PR048_012590 [Dryococelus australis]